MLSTELLDDIDAQAEAAGYAFADTEAIAQANPTSPEPTIFALDLAQFSKRKFKPREPMLGPWLCSQDLGMVFAMRGLGKTHFALAVAFAVASGGEFAKWKAPKAQKVLYLDGELSGATMKQRLGMHCPDTAPEPGYFRVFSPDLMPDGVALPDISTFAGQRQIDALIEPDTALIVIDNLSCWARTGRENESESWNDIAQWLLRLRRAGHAVLFVHHAGKNGGQRGASKREDIIDFSIELRHSKDYQPEQGACFELVFSKARHLKDKESEALAFTLETKQDADGNDISCGWKWDTLDQTTFNKVVQLANDGRTQTEIAAELELNKSTVSRHFSKAKGLRLIDGKAAK